MNRSVAALMFVLAMSFGASAYAAEPSLHEVYQAAEAGKLDEAQRMMREVLNAHPNSAKAHFVEAELLVKQGQLRPAANELASAEKLAPGLPFANAQAVSSLKNAISHQNASPHPAVQHDTLQAFPTSQPESRGGFSWGMLLGGLGLAAFISWVVKFMGARNRQFAGNQAPSGGFNGYQTATAPTPYGGTPQGYGSPAAAPGAGLGSQILGSLATGAAVGAGVVAGEALMHHFMDDKKPAPTPSQAYSSSNFDAIPDLPSTPLNDMGGNDFGISDTSWDDGGTSDNDWN